MKLRIAILAVALAGSCTPPPTPSAEVAAPKKVPELAGLVAGRAQRCISGQSGLMFRTSQEDSHLLLYDDGKTIWASSLGPSCGFEPGSSVVPNEIASYYCNGDFVLAGGSTILLPFGHRCALGDFTAYRSAK